MSGLRGGAGPKRLTPFRGFPVRTARVPAKMIAVERQSGSVSRRAALPSVVVSTLPGAPARLNPPKP